MILRFSLLVCSRSCSIAPARNVSAAAIARENFEFFSKLAIFASDVVFPVPLIPTKTMINGSPVSFFSCIRDIKSILPALSKVSVMN